jgi:NADH-quinone oxidoreductase subunit C
MDAVVIHENLKMRFGDNVGEVTVDAPDPFIFITAAGWPEVAEFLRDEPGYEFDYLAVVTAVDLGDNFQSVYHLLSLTHRHSLVIKVEVPRDKPEVPSVAHVWAAANWHEREEWDLMGVVYTGHPDLRRIMLPEDWVGHPLRKDYEEPKEYHGIAHERASVLDQLKAMDDANRPKPPPEPEPPKKDDPEKTAQA